MRKLLQSRLLPPYTGKSSSDELNYIIIISSIILSQDRTVQPESLSQVGAFCNTIKLYISFCVSHTQAGTESLSLSASSTWQQRLFTAISWPSFKGNETPLGCDRYRIQPGTLLINCFSIPPPLPLQSCSVLLEESLQAVSHSRGEVGKNF